MVRRARVFGVIALALVSLYVSGQASAAVLSSKRGFADVGAAYNNLQATGAGWYYTWGTGDANPGSFNAKHAPMIWGGTPSQGTINDIRSRPNVEWVLGFNEPERPDQANMTVAQAINSWTTISNGFAGSGKKLVSPAVADTGGADGGQQWLANFMSQATAANLQVDAVAFHWYGASTPSNPAGAASSFLSRVASYYNQYNKPVFITEFAIHDWGGNYSDAEIIEANRQFLDIVIPQLEAREYVAGYAWYHWFNDANLYSGNPLTPTPMGRRYVGALMTGESENLTGQDYGEHVIYLAGGTFGNNGRLPGTVHYLNALSGTSTISGASHWELSGTNWVRVQPGATLRKAGNNTITWSGPVTNRGTVEVSQGELRLLTRATFLESGNLRINAGGTLVLDGGRIDRTPLELRGGTIRSDTSAFHVVGGSVHDTTTFAGNADFAMNAPLTAGAGGEGAGLIKAGGGVLTLAAENTYSGSTGVNQGTLLLTGTTGFGATAIAAGATLTGSGIVRSDLLAAGGSVVRSQSLQVLGNFTQDAGAALELELANDTDFDRLIVDGMLDAVGDLAVTLEPGFNAVAGQSFDLLDFGSFAGGFANVALPGLAAGLAWDASRLEVDGTLQVVTDASPLAGDYNDDGIVDATDYTVWRDHLGAPAGTLPNDPDGTVVGAAQYLTWKNNYGNSLGSGSTFHAAVPEPTGVLLALLATGFTGFWRRRTSATH